MSSANPSRRDDFAGAGTGRSAGGDVVWLRVASVVTLLAIWVVCAWIVTLSFSRPAAVLPFPHQVISDFKGLATFAGPNAQISFANALSVIASNSLASAARLIAGLVIGGVLGVACGLLLGLSKLLRRVFQGPLLLIRTVPLFALIPLFLTWFGGSDAGIVAYIAFGVFAMLIVNTIAAIDNVPPIYTAFASTLGASRLRIYRTVVLPAIVPEVAGGLRVVAGIAWAILIGGELLAAQSGLGRILSLSEQYAYTGRMMAIVMILMIYTYIMDRIIIKIVSNITRWAPI